MTVLRSTAATSAARRRAWPRQVQQPVDDLRGAERLALDLLEQPRPRILGIGAFEQHLREARDAGQRRVHLVRDAGRKQADRRHLLRDLQLLFELHAARHVLDDDDRADGRDAACRRRRAAARPPRSQSSARAAASPRAIERDPRQRRALRRVAPRRAHRLDERRVEQIVEAAAGGIGPARRRTAAPARDSTGRRDRSRSRTSSPSSSDSRMFSLKARIRSSSSALTCSCRYRRAFSSAVAICPATAPSRPMSSLFSGSPVSLRPTASTAMVAFLRDARHEVVEARVAPELDLLDGETASTAIGSSSATM